MRAYSKNLGLKVNKVLEMRRKAAFFVFVIKFVMFYGILIIKS